MTQILVKAYPLLAAQGNLPGRFEAVTYRLASGAEGAVGAGSDSYALLWLALQGLLFGEAAQDLNAV